MPSLRAAVVGARRARQGTGAFIARELKRQGVEVAAIVGTSEASAERARAELAAAYGIDCRAFTSLEQLLDAEPVELVAVCSPTIAHEPQVALALERGCHLLAEKPLWWEEGLEARPDQVRARVEELCDLAAVKGCHVALNTQWPFTLEGFRALHPGALDGPLRSFTMRLSPISTGAAAIVDSGSHLLSMLHALAGPGRLEGIQVTVEDAERSDQRIEARYEHASGSAKVELRLKRALEPPRPAGYGINGKSVDRRVELPAYQLSFHADGRSVLLKDPLALSVEQVVRDVRAGNPWDREAVVAGMVQLQQLVAAGSSA
jgi:predicted dehydrogenase